MINLGRLLGIILVAASSATDAASAQSTPAARAFRVTLLGTGTPALSVERFGPSILVEAGTQTLLFDVGRGATIRLNQAGVPLSGVAAVFLTHLHSDHVNGLSDLWLTGWVPIRGGARKTPFRIFGPAGTREMMSYLEKAHQADIRFREADERLPASGIAIDARDIAEGVVYEHDGVRVTAFDVDHGDLIKPALGYRVDYRGRSVVMSGDTRPSQNLVRYATGATVLIHEVMGGTVNPSDSAGLRVMAHHSSPEQVARIFAESAPQLAVFSHIVPGGDSDAELLRRTRTAYKGTVEVGSDLMTIEVDSVPRVRRRATPPR